MCRRRARFWATALAVAAWMAGCGGGDAPSAAPTQPPNDSGSTGGSGGNGGVGSADTSQTVWLDAHNALRAGSFADVTVSPAPSPPLPALQWSTSAEAVAQAWANGCNYQHNPNRGADGVPRGENIAATGPADRADATPAYIVGQWGSEWSDYSYATNTCAAGRVCGHYTQLVWRGTTKVGCARARCTVNSPFGAQSPTWDYFVCDYEPPGNVVGQSPY